MSLEWKAARETNRGRQENNGRKDEEDGDMDLKIGKHPRRVQSMVRPSYGFGRGVLLSSLSTLVLRIWDAQPIGSTGGEWHSPRVKKNAQIAERVANYRPSKRRGTRSETD
jgi:hypothetical protein